VTDIECPGKIAWPDWVVDTPFLNAGEKTIFANEPVCTVLAYAANAEAAKKLAHDRVETIQNLLQSLNHMNVWQ
jgi:predicted ATP-grasp superfamily ATP-dependent carboligase